MADPQNTIRCPACAHEFTLAPGADLAHLTCPHCEAEIPDEALRGTDEVAEELAPGYRPGQRIGNYVIESILGAGGMAVVFRGRQLSLNRHVAIKVLPKQFVRNKLFVERFEAEAAVLASLNHPNIVSVIDRGTEGETYFIVMEYVEGETLKDRLHRKGRFTPDEIFRIAEGSLAGLEYAHKRGVVHRDIKPGNIMINREEMVKIADFGLAHLAKTRGGLDVTRDNQAMGTLKYMAPEQLTSARTVDRRADLYSFGVCLYEMLTGNLPLGMFKMPSEWDNTLDARWDDIILRALKMDPGERFTGADEMARALRDMATTPRVAALPGEAEAAGVPAEPAVSLTACAACGHDSAPTARKCEQCGADLDDLFDACPGCGKDVRMDLAACDGCGADLASHREKLRRSAEIIQQKARQFDADRQFDLALSELRKLRKFKTREYAGVRQNAAIWTDRVRRRRERFRQRTYEAGQRMIAEGRAERGLQLWESLPAEYADVTAKRKEILAQRDEAKGALSDGSRLFKAGDLAAAVAAWEKAADFWPLDNELHRRLTGAKIQLGNLNLKRSYLKECREAAARGDVLEASSLCRKVLDLDPNDSSAAALLKELEAKERQFAESEARAAPQVLVTKTRAEGQPRIPLSPVQIAFALGAAALLTLAVLIIFVFVPRAQRAREAGAAALFNEAISLKEKGDLEGAVGRCDLIARQYPGLSEARKASELAQEMRQTSLDARSRCDEAEAIAAKNDPASTVAAFKKFQELLAGPPVTAVASYAAFARKRVEELRERIALIQAERAAALEKLGEWQEAVKAYRAAAEGYAFTGEPIASKLARAQKRLADCAAQLAAGRQAAAAGKWDEAHRAAAAALDLVPTDAEAGKFLADIAPKLKPPDGMVLVTPGQYVVGGSEGNPRRTVTFPYGFFIEEKEVTCERFGDFLRATNRPFPLGWSDEGRPPAGTEQLPMVNVTWDEAAACAAWAGRQLPTEEQWECAGRGHRGQTYPWGDRWEPTGAIFGFGPTPAGAIAKDRSPFGCTEMAGNVAEWTATRLDVPAEPKANAEAKDAPGPARPPMPGMPPAPGAPPEAAATPAAPPVEKPGIYVVKGSSWAGTEKDRPTLIVPGANADASSEPLRAIVADPDVHEVTVRYRSNIEMLYFGVFGEESTAGVMVRKWMPNLEQWAEARFPVKAGEPIGAPTNVRVEEGGTKPRTRSVPVDFTTGCVALKQKPKSWLEFRDPYGIVRRAPFVAAGLARQVRVAEYREPAPPPDLSLETTAAASARMVGRANARYINVGFRCIKFLWTPPPPEKAPEKTPEPPAKTTEQPK